MSASIFVAFLGLAAASAPGPVDPAVSWIAESRYVQAQTTNLLARLEAEPLELFDERIVRTETAETTLVRSLAEQRSFSGDATVFVRGRSRVNAETIYGDIVIGQGVSRADYIFNVHRTTGFTLVCNLDATGHLDEFPAAAVRLVAPNGTYLINELILPEESLVLHLDGELEPGVYEFKTISRSTVMLGLLPDSVIAEATISLTFALGDSCLADLNHDDVVNASDMATLLAHWGIDPDGPPDFNYDGVVGSADLAYLVERWGPCED
jgi:hypothetical protein